MRSKSRLTAVEPRRAAETSRRGPLRERSQRLATQRRAMAHVRGDRREAGAATRIDALTPSPQANTQNAAQQMSTRTLTRCSPPQVLRSPYPFRVC